MRKWITISYSWKYIVVLIAGQIVICGLIGGSFGWFCHHEWVKPCKKVSEHAGDEIKRAELDFKSECDRQARIRVVKSLLSGYEKGFIALGRQGFWDLKNELCKLTRTEKPVKIYAGKWHKDWLEVMK